MNDLVRLPHDFEEKKFNWRKAAAPAGAALLLVALGWSAGAKVEALRGPSPELVAAKAAAARADKLRAEQHQEIADLRASVKSLKSQLEAQAEKAQGSEATVASLQKSLADAKSQTQALHLQMEKLAREAAKEALKPTQAAQPLPFERRAPDRAPTGSIAPQPPARPAAAPAAVKPAAAKRYAAYVLRDVNDGVAMVEGEDGMEEVAPGDILPGGARVQRFEKRGRGWVVLTDRGYIAPDMD